MRYGKLLAIAKFIFIKKRLKHLQASLKRKNFASYGGVLKY